MKRQCVQPHIFIKSDMKRHSEDGPRGARGVFVLSGMTGEESLGLSAFFACSVTRNGYMSALMKHNAPR